MIFIIPGSLELIVPDEEMILPVVNMEILPLTTDYTTITIPVQYFSSSLFPPWIKKQSAIGTVRGNRMGFTTKSGFQQVFVVILPDIPAKDAVIFKRQISVSGVGGIVHGWI